MDIETLKHVAALQRDLTQKVRLGLLAGSKSAPDLAKAVTAPRRQMLAMLEARLRGLTAERDRIVARYDQDIETQRRTLDEMHRALDEARRSDTGVSKPDREPPGPDTAARRPRSRRSDKRRPA